MSSLRLWCHVTPFLDLAALWHPSNIQLHGHFCQRGITTRLWTKYYPQWRTFNLFSTRPNPHLGRPPIEFSDWCRTALTLISKLCLWTNKYCCHKLRQRYIRQVQRLVGWQESLCRLMKYFSFYVVFVLFFVFFLKNIYHSYEMQCYIRLVCWLGSDSRLRDPWVDAALSTALEQNGERKKGRDAFCHRTADLEQQTLRDLHAPVTCQTGEEDRPHTPYLAGQAAEMPDSLQANTVVYFNIAYIYPADMTEVFFFRPLFFFF